MKLKKRLWARRVLRNRGYHLQVRDRLPWPYLLRDVTFTCIAWLLLSYLCWDFILTLHDGVLRELDGNPANDLDWAAFFRKLKISWAFVALSLSFLGSWFLVNMLLLLRTREQEGRSTPLLPLQIQVLAYGCLPEEVEKWRKARVLTIAVDDQGQIVEVEAKELDQHL